MKFFAAIILALPVFAAAHPHSSRQDDNGACNTGTTQCCEELYPSDSHTGSAFLKLAGRESGPGSDHVGVGCNNFIFGGNCNQQPVCCTDASASVISTGCVVIL